MSKLGLRKILKLKVSTFSEKSLELDNGKYLTWVPKILRVVSRKELYIDLRKLDLSSTVKINISQVIRSEPSERVIDFEHIRDCRYCH